ncbi:MAG: tetratricopeptide repeat protein [Desulfobacteraceae bacterium]|nr:tetratricopeptide repeat protein [Desulfobacteraceae bacterium]
MHKPALTSVFIIFILIQPCYASSKKDHAGWWIKEYGILENDKLVSGVHEIFNHVLDAADKRGSRFPKLLILREAGGPLALCLKDGTAILTQKALEICYSPLDKKVGDARAAFVIGHELAHLAKDDFWHMETLDALKKFGPDSGNISSVISEKQDISLRKNKELQADAYGILYASMAGYDPKVIADTKEHNFFREWTNRISGKTAYGDTTHPSPEQRIALLRLKIKAVINDIDLFDFGVRLYQLGRYEDALDFLETFNMKYPCREVFNNIGLAHFQTAMKVLAECNPKRAYRFKLATVLDIKSRAKSFIPRTCDDAIFRNAVRYFERACEKDVLYLPARVNYSSAHIMEGNYSKAMAKIIDEALKLRKDDPDSLNNLGIALYLLGPLPYVKVDMFNDASDVLKDVIKKYPGYAGAYYNLARIQGERGRNAAARENWERYLELDADSIYAETARKELGTGNSTVKAEKAGQSFHEPSPVRLGRFNDKTKKQLKGLARNVPKLGRSYCEYFTGNGIRVLALDKVVEMVETTVRQKMKFSDIILRYGKPRNTFHHKPSGITTCLYDNFVVDAQDGMVKKIIYFEN